MFPGCLLKNGVEAHRPALGQLPGLISAGTLLGAFALKAVGFEDFWIVFVLGFGVILPSAMATRLHVRRVGNREPESRSEPNPKHRAEHTALEALKRRYVDGELSETEFERQVERLLETGRQEANRRPGPRTNESPSRPIKVN